MLDMAAMKCFGSAVRAARIAHNWSQNQLSKKVTLSLPQDAPTFYQKKLSRIENADNSLNLKKEEILILQKICDLKDADVTPLLQTFSESAQQGLLKSRPQEDDQESEITVRLPIHIPGTSQLVFDVRSPTSELSGYCGEYHSLFFSTDSDDRRLVEGLFQIEEDPSDSSLCRAHMTLYNENHTEIKWYSGPFFINRHYRTWHCILIGHKKQEVCMLTSCHFNATLCPNQFNMALALTTSSGGQKRPTVHRLFLSRNPVPPKDRTLIQAQLMLNTDSICVSEDMLLALEDDTKRRLSKIKSKQKQSEYQAVLNAIDTIRHVGQKQTYYTINESIIFGSETIATEKHYRGVAVAKLRACSNNVYYNKVSQRVLEFCSDILEKKKNL